MRRVFPILASITLGLLTFACSGSPAADGCASTTDCVTGHACNAEGRCVPAAALRIVTDSLDPAAVGVAWTQTLMADGGLPPYRWALEADSPVWLSVSAETGALEGTPPGPGSQIPVQVRVTDASAGGGQSVVQTLSLDITECLTGANEVCHVPEEGRCFEGHRACQAGLWSGCTDLTHSVLFEACGPDCGACDPAKADRCTQGACRCGAEAPCAGTDICCAGACVDAENDPEHCGACGTVCAEQIQNADGPVCHLGVCDYGTCAVGHLNCDGDRSNGCETARDAEHCTYCDDRCEDSLLHAVGPVCTVYEENGETRHRCDYENCDFGFYDCDADTRNGCEHAADALNCTGCGQDCELAPGGNDCVLDPVAATYRCGCEDTDDCIAAGVGADPQCCDQTCTARDHPDHCGICGMSCAGQAAGPVCVDPEQQVCGCLADADCGPGRICCAQACRDIDEQNCGACERVCDPYADDGHVCNLDAGECYCQDDAGCNQRADSALACGGEGLDARCHCGLLLGCSGGPASTCCEADDGSRLCANLLTDPGHCGACGNECVLGQTCDNGVCTCDRTDARPCNLYGPAPTCAGNDYCTCTTNPDSPSPCGEGRTCCAGTAGGTGGPDGGPDEGCCWRACGQNEPGDCLY